MLEKLSDQQKDIILDFALDAMESRMELEAMEKEGWVVCYPSFGYMGVAEHSEMLTSLMSCTIYTVHARACNVAKKTTNGHGERPTVLTFAEAKRQRMLTNPLEHIEMMLRNVITQNK